MDMTMYDLTGKVAIITGSTRGIGNAIAKLMAKNGAAVVITGRKQEACDKVAAEIEAEGGKAIGVATSVDDPASRENLVKTTVEKLGRIDILVNNAGITRDTLLMRMTEQQWDLVMQVNLKSAFNFTHAVTPVMMKQRSGSIISLSSVVGINGNAGQANYAASKAGIIALTKSVAKELGARGVRANAIAPGFIITDMTKALSEETLKQFVSMIPMRRGGEPEEVAKVALFLASDLSSYVSGQVIQVNGAMA